MTFPSNPADQQTATVSGIIYQYNSADNSWTKTGNVSAFTIEGNLTVNGSVLSTSVYADQYFFSNGTPFISGGGGSGTSANAWTIITANYTATSGDRLFANTALGEITVTLPSAPVQGDTIQIVDVYNFATNSLIVNPGTNTIEGYGSELEVDIAAVDLEFVYAENTWQLISSVGPQGIQGNTGYTGSQGQQGISGYTGSAGADGISGYTGSVGLSDWKTISGNYTAVNRDRLLLNSSGGSFNVTLPTTPALGTYIQLTDAASLTANSVTIIANGSNIEGDPSDLILDVANATFEFIYDGTNWQVTSTAGPRGYVGSAGTLGYTGSAGTDGIIGQDGYTGSQGSIGPTGYTGSAGTDGIIGQDGYTGSQGYTGSRGETGLGFAIAKSYISEAALTSDTSPTGITAGQFAIIETGDVEDPENSRLYLWNGTAYSYISDLSGNIGLTGPQGTIGYTGSAGSLGYTGSQGLAGYVGSQGIVSYTVSATAPASPQSGELWYDSSTDILYVYVNDSVSSYWLDISTGVPGPSGYTGSAGSLLDAWTKQTANYVASSGNRIIADTSTGSFNITLPAAPDIGDYVIITDGYNFSTNSITILNNGSTIEGQSSNVVINVGSVDLEFVYDGSTWQIISTSGPTGYTGSRGQDGIIGVDGYTGSQGIQGNIGYTGSQGIIGYTGSQGIIGYTGSQGIIGGVTYNVTNNGTSAYVILGENNPAITVARGITYYFDINASGHPFWIKTAQTTGTLDAYTSGVTNNGVDIGIVTFTVPLDAPSTLYYICQFHASMVGTFTIRNIGELGYTGSQGLIGYTGSQGIQGTEGNIGPIGYTGSAGTGGGGGEGYTGSQGLPGALASSQYLDTFTGNGVQTAFTLSVAPVGVNQTTVTIDGITQIRSSYTLSGPVLTFIEAPALDDTIEVVSVLYGTTSFVDRQYTGNGAATTFTVTDGVTANSVLVMDNGLVQRPGVDYTISGNVVVFTEAPADQNAISIRELPAGAVGYTGSAGAGGSVGDILSPFLLMGG